MQILTPPGEAAHAFVFRPSPPMDGAANKDPQFQLTLLWDDGKHLDKLRKAIEDVAVAKFGAKAKQMLEKGQLKNPLRDGDETNQEWKHGKLFLTARSTERPEVVDADMSDIIDTSKFYGGCIARMDLWLYAFDKAGNKGVAAILNNVQKVGDGERKGGRRSAAEAFEALSDEDRELM